ncbi:hypothetical protein [Corynebacterium terpenotabidum]|uniref:Uncharacterized protein n=1 Tax=Corynebacterium terpenotabidum Y-11 TaxID=1200352 RepID=S4XDH4_9CORY|nr:hypothetical protein [Corynebacterium terpenotabidum]AGP30601.1 hypothetical protein A606_04760 [Corynebacterium terpenotabidum Y-11]
MAGKRSELRSAEQIPANHRTRRRLEWEDTRRPAWVMWLSVACLLALVVGVFALSNSDRMSKATAINGDVLGPETEETTDAYLARAAESLAAATGEDARWALVSPDAPADVAALTAIFTDQPDLRVSTLLAGGVQWPIPEPTSGHRREDVFTAARQRVAASAGVPDTDEVLAITGVIVYGTPEQLRAVAATEGVRAVEVLPPDAVYGRFGMRPLEDAVPTAETVPEETPVEETPVEEAPVEETPVEETPVEEASTDPVDTGQSEASAQ